MPRQCEHWRGNDRLFQQLDHLIQLRPQPVGQRVKDVYKRQLWDEIKRFDNPQTYYVDLSQKLWDIQQELLRKNRN